MGFRRATSTIFQRDSCVAAHDQLTAYRKTPMGSNRNFGLTFGLVLLLIGVWPWLRHGEPVRWWALVASVAFTGSALFAAGILEPLNRIWFKFGLALHKLVSPVVMGVLFFGAVLPMGLLLKLAGKDPLRLGSTGEASYWIPRAPPGPQAGSLNQQF